MNSFFCSVELLERPELKDKPVAVAGCSDDRHGIVLAKNQIAKERGIVTAETVNSARRKCPGLVLLPPHHEKYSHYFSVINNIYLRFSDMVEPFSVDESWIDITGSLKLFSKSGIELADCIRKTVYKETGLTLSAGVSYNKVFAKMGSDYKKPDATTEIRRDNFKELLWGLPAGELFFVGRVTAKKLAAMNIRSIGDIANADLRLLEQAFGKHGVLLHGYANGEDDAPVARWGERRETRSVGNGITFRRDLKGEADIRTAVTALSGRVAARLKKHGFRCRGVKIDIKTPEFISISRQRQLAEASDLSSDIYSAAMELMADNWVLESPIRLLTLTAIDIIEKGEEYTTQLSLFDSGEERANREKEKALEAALGKIRDKHGYSSITQASLIDNDLGIRIEEW